MTCARTRQDVGRGIERDMARYPAAAALMDKKVESKGVVSAADG